MKRNRVIMLFLSLFAAFMLVPGTANAAGDSSDAESKSICLSISADTDDDSDGDDEDYDGDDEDYDDEDYDGDDEDYDDEDYDDEDYDDEDDYDDDDEDYDDDEDDDEDYDDEEGFDDDDDYTDDDLDDDIFPIELSDTAISSAMPKISSLDSAKTDSADGDTVGGADAASDSSMKYKSGSARSADKIGSASGNSTDRNKLEQGVQTGDQNAVIAWSVIALAALLTCVGFLLSGRKRIRR